MVHGGEVHTFDFDPEQSRPTWGAFSKLGICYHEMDYFAYKGVIEGVLKGKKSYVICDGDHDQKTKELETFAPMIEKGSLISVHDWIAEVGRRDWTRHGVHFATWVKE